MEEKDRSRASSNPDNDHRAVTIEVANSQVGGQWPVSDAALAKLIELCVDICCRNGVQRLNYTGDVSGNLTMHKWFAATACPGPYLASKFPYIAAEVNKRLEENMSDQEVYEAMTRHLATLATSPYAEEASRAGVRSGLFSDGDKDGLVDNPRGILTREQLAVVLYRAGIIK